MALRPKQLGRAVAAALSLFAALAAPVTAAAEGRVFLISATDALREPAERDKLGPLLGTLGYRQVSWIDLADIESRVGVVAITDMRSDESCGRAVSLEGWSRGLDSAQEAVQLLAADRALEELSALNLDVVCLAQVPRQADLVLLGLITAEAHGLAAAGAQDFGIRMFHQEEQQHALAMAASFGPDLPPPSWLPPAMRASLLEMQAGYGADSSAPVYLGGSPKGLWLDGRQITTGFRRLNAGQHLVQATWGKDVVAARMLQVQPGRHTLVRVTPGDLAEGSEDLIIALQRLAAGAEPDPVVADLLSLMAQEADDALVVGLGPDGPQLWGRGRGGVVLRYPGGDLEPRSTGFADLGDEPAPPPVARPDPLPYTLGLGPALFWSNLQGGVTDGLDGVHGGVGLQTRITLARRLALAASLHPVARAQALPSGYGERWLWRAMIPGRLGLRLGAPVPSIHLEVGLDGGLLYLGRFEQHELRGLGIGSVGIFVPLAASFGLRFELWAGGAPGLVSAGLHLAGEGHPTPPPAGERP